MPSRWEKFRRILDSYHEKHLAYLPFLWLSLAMLLVFVLPGSQEYALWRVGLGFMVITVYYYCYYYLLKGSELRALCYLLIQLILICTRLFHWRYGETKPSRSEHSCSHCCCWGTCEDTQPSQTLTVGNSGVAQPWGRAQQWGEASWWITALLKIVTVMAETYHPLSHSWHSHSKKGSFGHLKFLPYITQPFSSLTQCHLGCVASENELSTMVILQLPAKSLRCSLLKNKYSFMPFLYLFVYSQYIVLQGPSGSRNNSLLG